MSRELQRKSVNSNRQITCQEGIVVTLDHCRFCVHSESFIVNGRAVPSPARLYCLRQKSLHDTVDLDDVEAVDCDDTTGEGYRSIMNIIT